MLQFVMEISADKIKVLALLQQWFIEKKQPFITLGGYAGTGKTTLLALFRKELFQKFPKLHVAFCSYTGKAARVLEEKLKIAGSIYPKDFTGTIHSLIYSPIVNKNEEIIGWELKPKISYDLIIIDEGSMVDETIWHDLLGYKIPIIAAGDHGQLPPINGKFNLLQKPQQILATIHRQMAENPIIQVSILARESGTIPIKKFGNHVEKFPLHDNESQEILNDLLETVDSETLVLCGYNKTRIRLNQHIRALHGIESPTPISGDKVICLRNNHEKGIYNGMIGIITSIEASDEAWYYAEIALDGLAKPFKGLIFQAQFNSPTPINFTGNRRQTIKGDLFDFGYALTVHKAQGSEAKRVILIEEKFSQMTPELWKRWLYTAVTRASEELYILG